ncbi:MAG: magnesium transporter, partial [Clostridia bacterium]|nr:magnesium transporter [Clostridia bacterium]
NKYAAFMKEFSEMNVVDAAEYLNYVDISVLPKVFRLLKKDKAAEIFPELEPELQEAIITSITDTEISKLVEELFIDDTVDMLEELPASVVSRILRVAKPDTRAEINKFLNYPPDSAGSVMTSEFLAVYSDMTVSEAIERIRRHGSDKETIYVIYVTDKSRTLVGYIELRDLIFSQQTELVGNIMDTAVISAQTIDNRETAALMISKYDLLALPITDTEGRLVGIVTVDDAMDVIEEAATEDIEIMAAISPTDKPYLKTGVFSTWKTRIPWLLLLLLSATFTGSIITHYENALGSMVILTAFIPMLMGTGGNAGGQASATIIRGLSLGEIRMGNILRIIWKEFRVSLLCGATLAVVIFGKALLIDRATVPVALVVAISLLLTVIIAKFVGCTLPILAKRLGFDPAVMASPFITTIVDAVSLLIYFQIASYALGL